MDDVAQRLGVRGFSRFLPHDKVHHLTALRTKGSQVAVVGDGVNDTLVLAAADVGISVGSASDLAARSGNVRLVTERLDGIPLFLEIARDVRRRIGLNLLFAFGFNSFGVALAVLGYLTPVIAALAMVLSSLAVVRISSGAGERASAPVQRRRPARPGVWASAEEAVR